MVFWICDSVPLVFGVGSYPPGPILESVFLRRVSVDKPPCALQSRGGHSLRAWVTVLRRCLCVALSSGRCPTGSAVARLDGMLQHRPKNISHCATPLLTCIADPSLERQPVALTPRSLAIAIMPNVWAAPFTKGLQLSFRRAESNGGLSSRPGLQHMPSPQHCSARCAASGA